MRGLPLFYSYIGLMRGEEEESGERRDGKEKKEEEGKREMLRGGAEEGERVGTLSKKSLELKKKRQSGNLDRRRSPRRAISRAGDK